MNDFDKHVLTVVHSDDKLCYFKFAQPDDNCYAFELIITNRAIYISGDLGAYTLNEGRGLGWFLGSVENHGYFLEKMAREFTIHRFSFAKSVDYVRECLDEALKCENFELARKYVEALEYISEQLSADDCTKSEFHRAVYDIVKDCDMYYPVCVPTERWSKQYEGLKAIAVAIRESRKNV